MLSNIIKTVKNVFTPRTEQQNLDAYIASQHPTSVADVEYWIEQYDRKQYTQRSSNFSYYYR